MPAMLAEVEQMVIEKCLAFVGACLNGGASDRQQGLGHNIAAARDAEFSVAASDMKIPPRDVYRWTPIQ